MTWVTGTPRMPARSATLTTDGISIGPASAARVAVALAASAALRSNASSWPRPDRLGLLLGGGSRRRRGHVALDVDAPAGQLGRKPRVLAFLADGQRQL